jgi:hypothetical protein
MGFAPENERFVVEAALDKSDAGIKKAGPT